MPFTLLFKLPYDNYSLLNLKANICQILIIRRDIYNLLTRHLKYPTNYVFMLKIIDVSRYQIHFEEVRIIIYLFNKYITKIS